MWGGRAAPLLQRQVVGRGARVAGETSKNVVMQQQLQQLQQGGRRPFSCSVWSAARAQQHAARLCVGGHSASSSRALSTEPTRSEQESALEQQQEQQHEQAQNAAELRRQVKEELGLRGRGPWLGKNSTDIVAPLERWERPSRRTRAGSAPHLGPFTPGGWYKWNRGKPRVVREKVLNRKLDSGTSLVPAGGPQQKKEVITKLDKGAKFRPRQGDEVWARSDPDRPWRVSQKKCNQTLELIRGVCYPDAMTILRLSDARISWSLLKLLEEARVRGEDRHGFDPELLYVKEAWVTRGPIMYRILPHSKGRAGRVRKPTSHITIILGEAESADDPRLKRRSSVYQAF